MSIIPPAKKFWERIRGVHSHSDWEYLRRIRRSPVFGSIVFFPILAAILSFGDQFSDVLEILVLNQQPENSLSLPFSFEVPLRLHLFYWSLFLLFSGSVIYTRCCPDMFVRYESKFDYAKTE